MKATVEDASGPAEARASGGISSWRTVSQFLRKGCSPALFHVLHRASGPPLDAEERATEPFMGGIMQHGYQCGMIWGATLAAGAEAHRRLGSGPAAEAQAVVAAQRLVDAFRAGNGDVNCYELTGIDDSSSTWQLIAHFLLRGGTGRCVRRGVRYARVALRETGAALSEPALEAPTAPVSCAAEVARRMGASDLHAVMAAGFAGGIGLSGGACGALGAALWLLGLKSLEGGSKKVAFKAPAALAAMDRFMKSTDYEFECSQIVGRKFEGVGDHAEHVRTGGCAKILDVLAAS